MALAQPSEGQLGYTKLFLFNTEAQPGTVSRPTPQRPSLCDKNASLSFNRYSLYLTPGASQILEVTGLGLRQEIL